MAALTRKCALVFVVAFTSAFQCLPNGLHADVLLYNADYFASRFDNSGNLVREYALTTNAGEESYEHFALSEDASTFYVLSNSMGFTNIYAFEVATGEYVGPKDVFGQDYSTFETVCCGSFGFLAENAVIQGHHAETAGGYFYVVSNAANYVPTTPNFPSVKVFHVGSGDFVHSHPFPSSVSILDLTVNQRLRGFALTSDGIYDLEANKVINAIAGDVGVEFGSDNRLYVTNRVTQEIRRYTFGYTFGNRTISVDTFLTAGELDMVPQSAHFGPNGDLYVLGTDVIGEKALIKRFDDVSSNFISTIDLDIEEFGGFPRSPGRTGFDDRFYILIPEPTTIGLCVSAAGGYMFRRRRRILAALGVLLRRAVAARF